MRKSLRKGSSLRQKIFWQVKGTLRLRECNAEHPDPWTDKLTQVNTTSTIRYAYDPLGRRISRSDGAGTTNYHLSSKSDFTNYDIDQNGKLTGAYLRGADGLISQTDYTGQSPVTSYDLFNPHGDTSAITDQNGNIVDSFAYSAFGSATAGGPPAYGYTGKWERYSDPSTGLVMMGARDYDPSLGRFTSADPVPGNPTDPQQLNRYPYVGNDPLTRYDLNGLSMLDDIFGIPGDIGGAAETVGNYTVGIYNDYRQGGVSALATDWLEGAGQFHLDVNATVGAGPGFTLGFDLSRKGFYNYCGLALTTPPGSVSAMAGPGEPSTGFNTAIGKGGFGIGGQWSVDSNFKPSVEVGLSTPGYQTSYY